MLLSHGLCVKHQPETDSSQQSAEKLLAWLNTFQENRSCQPSTDQSFMRSENSCQLILCKQQQTRLSLRQKGTENRSFSFTGLFAVSVMPWFLFHREASILRLKCTYAWPRVKLSWDISQEQSLPAKRGLNHGPLETRSLITSAWAKEWGSAAGAETDQYLLWVGHWGGHVTQSDQRVTFALLPWSNSSLCNFFLPTKLLPVMSIRYIVLLTFRSVA